MRRESGIAGFIDRTACSVFCLRVPKVHGKKLRKAIAYKLVTVFPDDIDEFDLDIRRNCDRGSYLVFVVPKGLAREPSYSSTLTVRNRMLYESGTVLFLHGSWIEVVVLASGAVEDSYVQQATPETIVDQVKELSPENEENPFVFCRKELALRLVSDNAANAARILCFEDLRLSITRDALFPSRNKLLRRRRALEWSLVFFFLIGMFCLFGSFHHEHRQKAVAAQRQRSALEKAVAERRALETKRDELEKSLAKLVEGREVSPFAAMSAVSAHLDGNTRIVSATFKSNYFQFESLSRNSLDTLSRFELDGMFENVSMRNLESSKGLDRSSISGSIISRSKPRERDVDIARDIELLQGFIELETRRNEYPPYRSKSAYAMAAKDLLEKNGCRITNFRFIESAMGDGIEYSFSATHGNAIRFLGVASVGSGRFEIVQMQIRNPDHGNIMDLTVQMRLSISTSESLKVCDHANDLGEYEGVNSIAKNYSAYAGGSVRKQPVLAAPAVLKNEVAAKELSLEYVGTIAGFDGNRYIFAKDLNGFLERFLLDGSGDMSCKRLAAGRYAANMNGTPCAIRMAD